jgi:hypothetical protein
VTTEIWQWKFQDITAPPLACPTLDATGAVFAVIDGDLVDHQLGGSGTVIFRMMVRVILARDPVKC